MKVLEPRKQGVFRSGSQNGLLGMAFTIFGGVFTVISLMGAEYAGALTAFVFAAVGASLWMGYRFRRVEVDDAGIRVFNALGKRIAEFPWEQITSYREAPRLAGRPKWGIETHSDRVELPTVEDHFGLQRAVVPRLLPEALRPTVRHSRPSLPRPTEEVHETHYRAKSDYAHIFTGFVFLLILGAIIATFAFFINADRIGRSVGDGFLIGLFILGAVLAFRWTLASVTKRASGRGIDMTAQGLTLREEGVEKTIAWSNLVLVEKGYVANFESQAFYIFLFDGETSITYRSDWRHADALLRYASAEAPAGTVFAGFE